MDPADPRGLQREPAQQKTDLEVFLRVHGPELLRKHAANIILGVLILAALGVFFYTRSNTKAHNADVLSQMSGQAYDLAIQARAGLLDSPTRSPEANRERQLKVQRALESADQVVTSADATPSQKAISLLAKAETYWALANTPADSLSTSQPVMGFETMPAERYLADSEAAYTEILSKYTDMKPAVGNALLGLAAISENRHDWDKAADWYRRAADDTSIAGEFRETAKARQRMLVDLRRPFTLATPTSGPTSGPASGPTSQPTTADAILPTVVDFRPTPSTLPHPSPLTPPSPSTTAPIGPASQPTTAPAAR